MSAARSRPLPAVRPRPITPDTFCRYGRLIAWPGPENPRSVNQWKIIVRDRNAAGWRIACLVVREREITRLEQHPETWESFEPLSGRALLFVAPAKRPRQWEAFYLDRPVVLKKAVWHGIVAISRQVQVKITENNRVRSRFFPLGRTLSIP
jgi:ureidoglycolate hydrolase